MNEYFKHLLWKAFGENLSRLMTIEAVMGKGNIRKGGGEGRRKS